MHDREDDRHERELNRDAEALRDQFGDRLVGEQRTAEVAGQCIARPFDVLNVERLIETVPMRDFGNLRGLGVVAGELLREIAGKSQQAESDHRNRDRDEHGNDKCGSR